jgi:hypothetical protein
LSRRRSGSVRTREFIQDVVDPAEVSAGTDTGALDADLPAHEDDARRAEDTATGEQNP